MSICSCWRRVVPTAPRRAYERDEQQLIDAALSLSVEEFALVVRAWLVLADPDGSKTARRHDAQAARVHLSRALHGWWSCPASSRPTTGQVLHAALEAVVDRRLPATTALCGSDVYRLVIGARSEVLDVGRPPPSGRPGMRRGFTARRDRGCVFPGCHRPPSWCDIHHCTPRSEAGDTAVNNGALLCRAHHTFIHRHDWKVVIRARGTPEIYRPDRTLFTIRRHAPPFEQLTGQDRPAAA